MRALVSSAAWLAWLSQLGWPALVLLLRRHPALAAHPCSCATPARSQPGYYSTDGTQCQKCALDKFSPAWGWGEHRAGMWGGSSVVKEVNCHLICQQCPCTPQQAQNHTPPCLAAPLPCLQPSAFPAPSAAWRLTTMTRSGMRAPPAACPGELTRLGCGGSAGGCPARSHVTCQCSRRKPTSAGLLSPAVILARTQPQLRQTPTAPACHARMATTAPASPPPPTTIASRFPMVGRRGCFAELNLQLPDCCKF